VRTPSWQDREPVKMVRENLASIQRRFRDELLAQIAAA